MYKAFLFDYDGVYTAGADNNAMFSRLASNLDVPLDAAKEWHGEIWIPFIKGTMSEDEVWAFFEVKYGKPIEPAKRKDVWFTWDELKPLPEMAKVVGALKVAGYPVGVLSNIFPTTKAIIEVNGGYDQFDFIIASCDVGYKKPEPEIFQAALDQLHSIKPHEVVFLDDIERNAKACEELGMKGIHVKDHRQAIADLRALVPNPTF